MRFAALSGRTVAMSGLVGRVTATLSVLVGVVTAGPVAPAGAAVERVEIVGTRFSPPQVEIEVDDSVIWRAEDGGHTVSAADGSFDSSHRGVMREGDQFRWRFRVPGTYAYFCRIHRDDGMRGSVVVVDPSDPGAATTTSRLSPVTAPAATSSTAPAPTTSTVPTTTTTRPLATSSSTSRSIATATTEPSGELLRPRTAPALNPAAPVGGSRAGARSTDWEAAAGGAEGEQGPAPPLVAVGLLVVAAVVGAAAVAVRRGRRA